MSQTPSAPPLDSILGSLPVGLYAVDRDLRVVLWRKDVPSQEPWPPEQWRRSPAEALGQPLEALLPPEEAERIIPAVKQVFETGCAVEETYEHRTDDAWRVFRIGRVPILTDGCVSHVLSWIQDITDTRRVERRLRTLDKAVQTMQIGVTVTDLAGKILYTNPADAKIHGYDVEELIGRDASIYTGGEPRRPMSPDQLNRMKSWRRESQNLTKDGKVVPVQLMSDVVMGATGAPIALVTTCEDITDRKRVEDQIERLAYRDTLTGLPNRRLFYDRLNVALLQAHRGGQRVAVLFVDLDGFKLVNDSLGHDVGDRLLCEVARRLESCVRLGDTVARLGGDEFTLLLPSVERPLDLETVADKVLAALRPPFQLAGQELFLSASMGVALYPDHGLNVESLVKNADAAMYRAKEMGRDTYRIYAREMSSTARDRLAMESGLRNALRCGELEAHYQPIVDADTGEPRGFEALVRWRHPAKGLLAPDEFIPLAEATGLVVPLGVWILRAASEQLVSWHERGHPELTVAVNISGRHLQHPALLDQVREVLYETGLPPRSLTLEITETASMQKVEQTLGTLQALRSLGVRVSIDDFGTGYSSLGHLNRFPIDALKIDRSFIVGIGPGPGRGQAPIAEAVIALAHTLNLHVIAEGVETEAQRRLLQELRCDGMQGHLFSPAMPPVACERYLDAFATSRAEQARR